MYSLANVFSSLNVQSWRFMDIVVYCNTLRSYKTGFLEIENTFFNVTALVPMFTVIISSPCTRDKHTKASHAKCNFNLNRERTKSDCRIFTDLNLSVRLNWHVVDDFFLNCLMFFITILSLTYLISYSWDLFTVLSDRIATET